MPKLEGNPYNLLSFQTEAYTDSAGLTIDPAPDTLIRVFLAWKGLDAPVEVEPQKLTAPEALASPPWSGAARKWIEDCAEKPPDLTGSGGFLRNACALGRNMVS